MDLRDLLAMAKIVIGSLGGGGVLVLGLSDWIGKIWSFRSIRRSCLSPRCLPTRLGKQIRAGSLREVPCLVENLDGAAT